jgi:hypothetical protein
MCSLQRTSIPITAQAIKSATSSGTGAARDKAGNIDLMGRPIKYEGSKKKDGSLNNDGEIPTSSNPNPQNTTTSTPTVEKEMLSDRLTNAQKAMDEKIDAIKSMGPSAADQLASQMANQPPMTPPSSSGSSPSPSSPSSSRPSSSSSPELKNTITSLKGALKKQDEQIASLQKALLNRDRDKIDPLRPPKFGDEKTQKDTKENPTTVAETKSEDKTEVAEKDKSENQYAIGEINFENDEEQVELETNTKEEIA